MKHILNFLTGGLIIGSLLISCSPTSNQSFEDKLKDSKHQETVLTMLAENHDLSNRFISKMMESDHGTGMLVDKLVNAASEDSVLARKMSKMIIEFPELMLMTMHHFMPVINDNEHMCEGFCDHVMEQPKIAEEMCHDIKEQGSMSCCQ